MESTKPARVTKACVPCRRRKDKCDAEVPCKNCVSRGIDCTNATPLKKRGLPPGYTKSLERKLTRLESILDSLANLPLTLQQIEAMKEHVLSQPQGKYDEELSSTLQKYLPPAMDNRSTNVAATADFPANLPSPPTSVNGGHPPDNTPNGLLSVNENSVITHVGVTNGLHLVTPCEIVDHEIWRITSTLCAHRKQTERWTYSRDLDQFIFFLPPLEVRQRLIDRFFADTNPYLIFMNRKLVEDISSACADPSLNLLSDLRLPHASTRHRQNERAVMLLLAVIATGINHLEQPFQGLDTSIDYKQLTVDLLAQLGDHSTLETVQVLLMLTWKEEGCSHSEQAWVHLGHAIRVAIHLGLNRSCRNWTFLDDQERKAREDCWWSCYVADSVISLRLGRAPTIQEDDYDVDPPTSTFEPSNYRVFAHVVRLCTLINRVIREFYSVRRRTRGITKIARDEIHQELMAWAADLPRDLQLSSDNIVCIHPILTMHLLFNTILLVLHRPFLGDPASEETYRTAAVASSFILASYQYTTTGLQSNPFIIQHTFVCAIALLYMTQSTEVDISEPAKTGLETCLAAFRASSRTWVAATHALKLLANEGVAS